MGGGLGGPQASRLCLSLLEVSLVRGGGGGGGGGGGRGGGGGEAGHRTEFGSGLHTTQKTPPHHPPNSPFQLIKKFGAEGGI